MEPLDLRSIRFDFLPGDVLYLVLKSGFNCEVYAARFHTVVWLCIERSGKFCKDLLGLSNRTLVRSEAFMIAMLMLTQLPEKDEIQIQGHLIVFTRVYSGTQFLK